MKRTIGAISLCLAVSLLAGCGGGDDASDSGGSAGDQVATAQDADRDRPSSDASVTKEDGATPRKGTTVKLADSDFGRMLFDSQEQAIYIFERDERNKSNCYGECADAWPPVFTKGEPQAGDGVNASLLGTTKRRDGKLQVTYDGKPLYYYAHEGRGEVKCHNVNLNGGFWWVIGADGERLG
jgi:predicted lipoprotein with Yx(FWY)xxD motif